MLKTKTATENIERKKNETIQKDFTFIILIAAIVMILLLCQLIYVFIGVVVAYCVLSFSILASVITVILEERNKCKQKKFIYTTQGNLEITEL